MGRFAKGEIVLVNFPFSDLSQTKLRPALVLAEAEYGDLLLCQITSKTYGDRNAVQIDQADFRSGSLPLTSYARPGRITTAADSLVVRPLGLLTESKRAEIAAAIANLIG
jgi:mRNA interferase MazF